MVSREIRISGSFVQVRYPRGGRWVTVAVSQNRRVATRLGADAYRYLGNASGQLPSQVRVVTAAHLAAEGGTPAVVAALRDFEHRAIAVSAGDETMA